MGSVINFPEARRVGRDVTPGAGEKATIMILPVVRIERPTTDRPPDEAAPTTATTGRKRRRRARRS
jgi:hypothetical protein